jgi:hypothetical protein
VHFLVAAKQLANLAVARDPSSQPPSLRIFFGRHQLRPSRLFPGGGCESRRARAPARPASKPNTPPWRQSVKNTPVQDSQPRWRIAFVKPIVEAFAEGRDRDAGRQTGRQVRLDAELTTRHALSSDGNLGSRKVVSQHVEPGFSQHLARNAAAATQLDNPAGGNPAVAQGLHEPSDSRLGAGAVTGVVERSVR